MSDEPRIRVDGIIGGTPEQVAVSKLQKLMAVQQYIAEHAEAPPKAFVFLALDEGSVEFIGAGSPDDYAYLIHGAAQRLPQITLRGLMSAAGGEA